MKVIVRRSVRRGARGVRLRIHLFFNGAPGPSIIFSSKETDSIYKLLDKYKNKRSEVRGQRSEDGGQKSE
jgi:hypothetical protein